jgi:CO/xanthine dehydrogenase FAD-binding subunit
MYPNVFDYFRPESLAEAVALLGQHGEDARPLAGGQTLVNVMKVRAASPDVVIDLAGLEELRGVRATDDGGLETCVSDDAEPERRRRSFEAIEERVHQLHGEIAVGAGEAGGTEVRVTLPPYTAQR